MEQAIYYIALGLVSLGCFILGKYVFPAAGHVMSTLLDDYPVLLQYGTAVCQYIAQYLSHMGGVEKNVYAASLIKEAAETVGIILTEEQARAIAQAAYENMKAGASAA